MVVSNNVFDDRETSIAAGKKLARPSEEETVVISGLAGTFPESEDVEVFQQKLFDKDDMITNDDRRWTVEHPEIPHRTGKIPAVSKFDASFFGIHHNQADTMDPMCRILLEKAYEAVIDSGTNPDDLKGSKTGVFVGACYSESEKTWFYEKLQANGFAVTGCVRSMMANRISYYLGLDGPSCTVDTACSSSMYAFEYGYRAIREGLCDAAIIGGCNLCLHPFVSLQFSRIGVLSPDGKCKPFDIDANGYCRSEAICAVLLQKKKDANRIYASVVHAKTNCDGFKEQGITYPSGEIQHQLFENFYDECEIDPLTLNYLEAHGTGTKVGDPEEVKALVKAFCEGRNTPLKIGSVKSNIGHTEPVSGLCSITKVIIAMETGIIPPNINLNKLRTDIDALQDGSIEVITEPTPWEGGLVGINSFGFGGANCHILLKSNQKEKINGGFPNDDIPRLINTSGRTHEAVQKIFTKVKKLPFDVELCKLFHNIHRKNIQGHNYRGFITLQKGESNLPRALTKEIKLQSSKRKPIYFYFPGLYTDLKNFDKTLLEIPIFSNMMTKLSKTLSMDVFNVMNNVENKFSDIISTFVTVSAIQIAMVDLLKSVGVVPDKVVGSSIGEIACAYADGCITAEEAILTSYYIAAALKEINFTSYLMVHIGLSASEVKKMVPNQIEVSAASAKTSTAIGPKQIMKSLLESLKLKKISYNQVNTFETPIHSSFVKSVKTKMHSYLKEVIRSNKSISPKWISSVISDKCDGEYFCANILDSLQYDGVLRVGDDALVLEIGPNGSHHLSDTVTMKVLDETYGTNCSSFISSLGRLYLEGVDMDPSVIYPEVSLPVSRSTPMISPFLSWDHSEDWYVIIYKEGKVNSGEKTVCITLDDEETEYISGHLVDGRNLYPATGYLALVWETVGNNLGKHFSEVPIVIENVKFHRATTLSKDGSIDFTVLVQRATGYFEVVEGGAAIVTGRIVVPDNVSDEMCNLESDKDTKSFPMSSKDFYKELRLRGYNYKGLFRSVVKANVKECEGAIKWHKNWVAFMDNMLQMQIILTDTRGLFVPTSIDRVVIDPKKHLQYIERFEDTNEIPVVVYKNVELIKSGGIEIYGLKANAIARRKNLGEPVLEKYHFIPLESNNYDMNQVIRIMVQTALENESTVNVKVTEVPSNKAILSPIIAEVLGDLPLLQPEITVLTNPDNPLVEGIAPEIIVEEKKIVTDQSAMIVVASNVLKEENRQMLDSCLYAMKDGGFLIARENLLSTLQVNFLQQIQSYIIDDEQIVLLRKVKGLSATEDDKAIIEVTRENLDWLPKAQEALNNEKVKRVYFVAQNDELSGIIGLVNCIRKEPNGTKARCIFTFDGAPKFSLQDPFYTSQLNKDLAINIYKNGNWGTYRHLLIEMPKEVKAEYVIANNLVRGDVSSMTWLQANIDELIEKGEDLVADVCYSALNFRDVMLTTGKISVENIQKKRMKQDCVIGFEFSGYHKGKRVMGLIPTKALSSKVSLESKFYWEVPKDWTLEEAATVPCVYLTVIYGVIMSGNLKEGESILIHSGTGGIGQAAINIALSYGCTVFTTVGTPEKRRFLLDNFPQLPEKNIGNSRDTSFEEMVMRETNGRGVDIVLNSLAEEKLLASIRCLANGGRFIEIGKFDITNNNAIGMELYKRGGKFMGVMVDNHFDRTEIAYQEQLGYDLMYEEIKRGSVKPLMRTIFKKEEIEQAFRYMGSGKHMGKILIKVNEEDEEVPMTTSPLYNCKPRFCSNIHGCYIITGGLGGFGLELADWLVLRGARNLILVSRRGVTNGYQDLRINIWKSYGVNVLVSTLDVTKPEGVASLLEEAESIAPLIGIFNLAVVLRDGIFVNQTSETFKDSIGPKADSTVYLDQYSRKMCPKLEHFVVFSSVSCGRGNGGQSNYGWSNSVMERVCEKRAMEGFPATAIQWGAVGDAGLVAEMQDEHIEIVIGGTLQQRINSCLETLDGYLTQKHAIVSSMVVAEKKVGGSSGDNIVDCVANILGLRDLKNVSLHSSLAELGMDSMMAVEIKQTLEREFEVFLSPQDIRAITFARLLELSTDKEEPSSDRDVIEEKQPLIDLNMMINLLGQRETSNAIELVRTSSNKSPNNNIFIAPGIEGESGILDDIGHLIQSNVYFVQFNNKHCETVEDISEYLLPKILNVLTPGSSYNLVGYSWGGLPILDMAYKLEKLGYTGKICLVDSSPDLMRAIHRLWNSGDLQTSILHRVIEILCPQEKSKLDKILENKENWEERLGVVVEWSKTFASDVDLKSIINGIYCRAHSIEKLKDIPDKGLKSPILLIRPTVIVVPGEKDYGLSKYTTGATTVKFVEGNHLTVIKDKVTAEAINLFMGFQDEMAKTPILNTTANINAVMENVKNI